MHNSLTVTRRLLTCQCRSWIESCWLVQNIWWAQWQTLDPHPRIRHPRRLHNFRLPPSPSRSRRSEIFSPKFGFRVTVLVTDDEPVHSRSNKNGFRHWAGNEPVHIPIQTEKNGRSDASHNHQLFVIISL